MIKLIKQLFIPGTIVGARARRLQVAYSLVRETGKYIYIMNKSHAAARPPDHDCWVHSFSKGDSVQPGKLNCVASEQIK